LSKAATMMPMSEDLPVMPMPMLEVTPRVWALVAMGWAENVARMARVEEEQEGDDKRLRECTCTVI